MIAIKNLDNEIIFIKPGDIIKIENQNCIVLNNEILVCLSTADICQKCFDYISMKLVNHYQFIDLKTFIQKEL